MSVGAIDRTGAELVLEALECLGVDVLFGLPGVHALPLYEALDRRRTIRHVAVRHEQAAGFAADGYARTSGRLGVALLTPGPGVANAGASMNESYASSSPVLFLVAQISSDVLGRGVGAIHEMRDHAGLLRSLCKGYMIIESPEEARAVIEEAAGLAWSGRPGPVAVEIPVDVQQRRVGAAASPPPPASCGGPPVPGGPPRRQSPSPEAIDSAVRLLAEAQRPLIMAGGGVIRSGAWDDLRRLAEHLQAPVVTTFEGLGSLPAHHPLLCGNLHGLFPFRGELLRGPFCETIWSQADSLLAVGTRFTESTTARWKLQLPGRLIHLDSDPSAFALHYPPAAAVQADARLGLEALLRALPEHEGARHTWGGEGEAGRLVALIREATQGLLRSAGVLEPEILAALRRALPPESIVANDMTLLTYWAGRYFPVEQPRTFLYPFGSVVLGFGLPAGLGAAVASPGVPVAVLCGDGGFLFTSEELAVVSRLALPVTIVLFNDSSYGVLREFLLQSYGRTFETELHNPDFLMLARAYGIPATRVEDPAALEGEVARGVASGGPSLIEYRGVFNAPWLAPSGPYSPGAGEIPCECA